MEGHRQGSAPGPASRRPAVAEGVGRRGVARAAAIGALASLLATGRATPAAAPPVVVALETDRGVIVVEVDVARAPVTAANFLRYVDEARYQGGVFHRTVRLDNQPGKDVLIEVIQAGVNPEFADKDHAPIPLERTSRTGLRHEDGTVSMARDGPDTATSDFFICIGPQPSLDEGGRRNPDGQGFAAFGRVVRGMEVVRQIQGAPADGQKLTPPVRIVSARRR